MPTASFSSRYNGYAYNLGYVSKCARKGNGLNKSSQIKKTTFIHLVFRLVTLVNVDIVLILNWTLEMMHKQMSKLLAIYMFTLLHSHTLRVKKPLQTDAIKFSLNVQKKSFLVLYKGLYM